MPNHGSKKIYTPRHWLFYAGVVLVAGSVAGAAVAALNLSSGLTFAVGAVTSTIICTMALREDLFRQAPVRHEQRNRRA
jgi:uncharacterized protein (DUF697 family)